MYIYIYHNNHETISSQPPPAGQHPPSRHVLRIQVANILFDSKRVSLAHPRGCARSNLHPARRTQHIRPPSVRPSGNGRLDLHCRLSNKFDIHLRPAKPYSRSPLAVPDGIRCHCLSQRRHHLDCGIAVPMRTCQRLPLPPWAWAWASWPPQPLACASPRVPPPIGHPSLPSIRT